MPGTFGSLEIGRRSLQAHQQALQTIGHNIANANTPGYSRQAVTMAATDPYTVPSAVRAATTGQVGTGVNVTSIKRYRESFLDTQYRNENSSLGRWETRQELLRQIEGVVMEPGEAGLRSELDRFWQALQAVGNNPELLGPRAELVQRAQGMAETFRHINAQLRTLRSNIDGNVRNEAREINELATQLADLNRQIASSLAIGDSPNDLRDRRDQMLDQLSKLVDISTVEDSYGNVNVFIGSVGLVQGQDTNQIAIVNDAANNNMAKLQWSGLNMDVRIAGGKLAGQVTVRDNTLSQMIGDLNTLAGTLITEVNAIHQGGYGLDGVSGRDFFTGTDAATIAVDAGVIADPSTIAASKAANTPGDGSNAIDMADLRFASQAALGNTTFNDFNRAMVTQLGVDSQEAIRMSDNQTVLVNLIDNQRLSVSAVSIDEEMTNMVKMQQGYAAAARFITAIDELIDVVVNRMGIVGR